MRADAEKHSSGSVQPDCSALVFALSYDDLQEIHRLTGMVCGWKMSLPTKMISQAQEVHRRVIALNRIDLTQRQRLSEAKAFIARFNTMFAKAQNDPDQRPGDKTNG
jgi:hypothetical protein